MKLSDLIDVEAQIAEDEGADRDALLARDRAVVAALRADASADGLERGQTEADCHALLAAWARHLAAKRAEPSAGERIARGRRVTTLVLGLLGAALGWGTARVVLHYDGSTPVNVMAFLWVLVVLQAALFTTLLFAGAIATLFPAAADRFPIVSDVRALLRFATYRIATRITTERRKREDERVEAWFKVLHRLRGKSTLYRTVERWLFTQTAQVFGIAFNVAAIVACAQLVAFSDLAFAWSTTLDIDAKAFSTLVQALAVPWGWFLPDAVPTAELVELSRYSRLDGAYLGAGGARAHDPLLVGRWWRFLIAAVATYGLIPRLLTWVVARVSLARALANLPLDTPDVARVLRRLRLPRVQTQALTPESAVAAGNVSAGGLGSPLGSSRSSPESSGLVASTSVAGGGRAASPEGGAGASGHPTDGAVDAAPTPQERSRAGLAAALRTAPRATPNASAAAPAASQTAASAASKTASSAASSTATSAASKTATSAASKTATSAASKTATSATSKTATSQPDASAASRTAASVAPETAAERCTAILWRDVPGERHALAALLRLQLGLQPDPFTTAGGLDFSEDAASQQLAADRGATVVVLAEAWEAPDKSVLRFLRTLRGVVGASRTILVGLVHAGEGGDYAAPAADDIKIWEERLATLEDPYVGLEPLRPAA